MVLTAQPSIQQPPEEALDEGWWESLLADEERFLSSQRPHAAQGMLPRRPSPRPAASASTPSSASPSAPSSVSSSAPSSVPASASPSVSVDWQYAEAVYRQDQVVTLLVSGSNRGGLLVEGDRLAGFVPYSHLADMTCQSDAERERFLESYIGRELTLKVIECVPAEGRIVFSERAARAGAGRRTELFSYLRPGAIVQGEVTNITDFGVFVDLGGVEGLIHISELSWGRVIHPGHIVQMGQRLQVQVIDILPERCRIALSLKRLQPNPWETAPARYAIGDIVPATITSIVSYGLFARLDEGLEGLVHNSEIPPEHMPARKNFRENQRIHVRILHLDAPHQRLGLSLKLDGKHPA